MLCMMTIWPILYHFVTVLGRKWMKFLKKFHIIISKFLLKKKSWYVNLGLSRIDLLKRFEKINCFGVKSLQEKRPKSYNLYLWQAVCPQYQIAGFKSNFKSVYNRSRGKQVDMFWFYVRFKIDASKKIY